MNYKTIGLTPTFLVSGLALGAIVALALTLLASVRQRRRDLALLKTIGFVRRQLAAAVAWQATVAALVGIVVGIPLGVVAGRWLWDLFADQIYAVPVSHRVRAVAVPRRRGNAGAGQRRGRGAGPDRGAHADGVHAARRVARPLSAHAGAAEIVDLVALAHGGDQLPHQRATTGRDRCG